MLLLFVAYLLIEIAVLVGIGGEIGILATMLVIVATAALGAILLRVQGFGILNRIRSEVQAGRVPGRELAHAFMIVLAGLLLMAPGFVSDILGFLLFLPPLRDLGWSLVRRKLTLVVTNRGERPAWSDRKPQPTIDLDEGEYSRRGGRPIPPNE